MEGEAPSWVELKIPLQLLADLFKSFIATHPSVQYPDLPGDLAVDTAAVEPAPLQVVQGPAVQAGVPNEPRSREEAYRQLLTIADYLARTEPHSPVPYLLKKGVEWGNRPLEELLSELIGSDEQARKVWALLGVL